MSYQVLARKWRPKLFTEVVGQEQSLKILTNALALERVHHAYLFSGTRGVGKTSIARLLAKALNCEKGVTAEPCGQCGCCQDLEQGRFVDLIEIDAASRTKVEDTREILDNIQYLPTRGRFKVYLVDEVHMLSRSSFNALLKTLEEPPEHVKFLLATTDPQKLPITILSRCLHLHLSLIDTVKMAKQLEHILRAEKILYQAKAIQLLAKGANGSMRDALSLTDQAIAFGNGQIETASVALMLGTLDDAIPFVLIESLVNADPSSLMAQLTQAAEQGADFEIILIDSLRLLHQVAILQLVPSALGEYQHKEERIRHLAQRVLPQDIQLYYQILLNGKKELDAMGNKRMIIEMTFLRALAFQPKLFYPNQNVKSLSDMPDKSSLTADTRLSLTPKIDEGNKLASQVVEPPISESDALASVSNTLTENDLSSITQQILKAREKLINQAVPKPKKPEVRPIKLTAPKVAKATLPKNTEKAEPISDGNYQWQAKTVTQKNENDLTPKNLKKRVDHEKIPELMAKLITEVCEMDSWSAEIESLGLTPIIKQLAINSFLEEKTENDLTLHLRSSQAHINKKAHCDSLQASISSNRNKPIRLAIILDDDPSKQTPLELREAIYQKKLAAAKKTILGDEKVALLCEYFDAQIDEESIRPV